MTRKHNLPLLGLLLAGALAGCGGSGPSSTASVSRSSPSRTSASATQRTTAVASATTSSSAAVSRATRTRTSTTRRTTTSTAARTSTHRVRPVGPPPAGPLDLAAAVAVCRREVASAPLTDAESSQLNHLCLTAATLGRRQLAAAERRICLTVIEDSAPGLSGPAIVAARQSCARY